jgi:hypothetical protein
MAAKAGNRRLGELFREARARKIDPRHQVIAATTNVAQGAAARLPFSAEPRCL